MSAMVSENRHGLKASKILTIEDSATPSNSIVSWQRKRFCPSLRCDWLKNVLDSDSLIPGKENQMSKGKLFVERRPEGDYAVRKPNSQRASVVAPTQSEAIQRARHLNPNATVLVERVRDTTVGKPDKWRKP